MAGLIILSYYSVVAGWSLFYFVKTIGWSVGGFPAGMQTGDLFAGIVGNGGLQFFLSALFMAATVGIVYFGIHRGIERVARIFLPVLFAILVLLLVSVLTMDGAGAALAFIFRPNFAELEPGGILEALGHSFFTLSSGWER